MRILGSNATIRSPRRSYNYSFTELVNQRVTAVAIGYFDQLSGYQKHQSRERKEKECPTCWAYEGTFTMQIPATPKAVARVKPSPSQSRRARQPNPTPAKLDTTPSTMLPRSHHGPPVRRTAQPSIPRSRSDTSCARQTFSPGVRLPMPIHSI